MSKLTRFSLSLVIFSALAAPTVHMHYFYPEFVGEFVFGAVMGLAACVTYMFHMRMHKYSRVENVLSRITDLAVANPELDKALYKADQATALDLTFDDYLLALKHQMENDIQPVDRWIDWSNIITLAKHQMKASKIEVAPELTEAEFLTLLEQYLNREK